MRIVGRERECAEIDAFLGGTAAAASLLGLGGPAGIGKTTLWNYAVSRAIELGARVLCTTGSPAESHLSMNGVRDLFAGSFAEVAGQLAPPMRHALAVALLLEDADQRGERSAVAVAASRAVDLLSQGSPVLIAIDDGQWLDDDSRSVVEFLVRRLGPGRLALLAERAEPGQRPAELGGRWIEPPPLTRRETGVLLDHAYPGSFGRIDVGLIHEQAEGNPLLALRLGERAVAAGSGRAATGSVVELLHEQIAGMPAETKSVLAAAALMPEPTLAQLAAVTPVDAARSLHDAVAHQLVTVRDGNVVFAHPLVRSVALTLSSTDERRALHLRLAELATDVEHRAWHLARGTGQASREVAAIVEHAAAVALARGRPAAAATLAADAVRLTPPDDGVSRARRLIAEVDHRFSAGDTTGAAAVLDANLGTEPPGPGQARLLLRRARVHRFADDIGACVEVLDRALGECGDDAALEGAVREGLAWGLLLLRHDLAAAVEHAAAACAAATATGDEVALAEALAIHGLTSCVAGRRWQATMNRAIALEPAMGDVGVLRLPSFALAYCLGVVDQFDSARLVLDDLLGRAAKLGDEASSAVLLNHRAMGSFLAGDLVAAEHDAQDALSRATSSHQVPAATSILGKLALVAAVRGDEESLTRHADAALSAGAAGSVAGGQESVTWAVGAAALWAGDVSGGRRVLEPLVTTLIDAGVRAPGELRPLPDLVEALIAIGDHDEAERLLDLFDHAAAVHEQPSARADAARCRGLLGLATRRRRAALAHFADAVRWAERGAVAFTRGRAQLALGEAAAAFGQRPRATTQLAAAVSTFERMGATRWSEHASRALHQAGGSRPDRDGLTAAERRVAESVARGCTNREAAGELHISVHTVEAALTAIYRKLAVRSRTEMVRRLSQVDATSGR